MIKKIQTPIPDKRMTETVLTARDKRKAKLAKLLLAELEVIQHPGKRL